MHQLEANISMNIDNQQNGDFLRIFKNNFLNFLRGLSLSLDHHWISVTSVPVSVISVPWPVMSKSEPGNKGGPERVKAKYVDLYSASSWSASNALPLPVGRRWFPQANPTARHQRTLRDHAIRVDVSRDMPVYSPCLRRVLIQPRLAQAE